MDRLSGKIVAVRSDVTGFLVALMYRLPPTPDIDAAMSAFDEFTSGIGPEADVVGKLC